MWYFVMVLSVRKAKDLRFVTNFALAGEGRRELRTTFLLPLTQQNIEGMSCVFNFRLKLEKLQLNQFILNGSVKRKPLDVFKQS